MLHVLLLLLRCGVSGVTDEHTSSSYIHVHEGGGKKRRNWGEYLELSYMYLKISTPPKKHGISWVRPYGNAASTIAVGSWTPGVGPSESAWSSASAQRKGQNLI